MFELFDSIAGYYISHREEVPVSVDPLTSLPRYILESGAELRVTPDLHPLRELIFESRIQAFGIHRFENSV
ncbi:DUF6886 family protein [Alicyclobacillus ferrooxydans]|uniref:DUF6886 family protein n=1 Tax=Alicyclobacillus ferrooxydans TaxID=471514 RepID=UPI003CCB9BE2